MIEYAHTDYEIWSSMFAGIKCQDDRAGERGARPDWVWEFWQNDWVFREDSEVWGTQTPLSFQIKSLTPLRMPSAIPVHSP